MRVMAIDYGDRRIGIAVSDALGVLCGEAFTVKEWDMERAAQRIAQEAAKQSGRAHVPQIGIISEKKLPELLRAHDLVLVPWEEAHAVSLAQAVRANRNARDIAVIIGPEGGMTQEEVDAFHHAGAEPVTMGPRIFRTETAGLAALIMLLYEHGEYGSAEVD